MKIICNECQSNFKIPDEKLSPGMRKSIPCPKCKEPILIEIPESSSVDLPESEEALYGFDEEEYLDQPGGSERSFDFVEEEEKKALLCEEDEEVRKHIRNVLDVMEYHVSEATDDRNGLKRLRYDSFDLIVINESFFSKSLENNSMLAYLQRLEMSVRREFFVVLLSQRFRTMDHMAAFHKSTNIVINVSHMNDFDKILRRGLADWDLFYRAFKELKK